MKGGSRAAAALAGLGKAAKRRLWRSKRAAFEEAAHMRPLAGTAMCNAATVEAAQRRVSAQWQKIFRVRRTRNRERGFPRCRGFVCL